MRRRPGAGRRAASELRPGAAVCPAHPVPGARASGSGASRAPRHVPPSEPLRRSQATAEVLLWQSGFRLLAFCGIVISFLLFRLGGLMIADSLGAHPVSYTHLTLPTNSRV